ncbi:MAG: serine O-acetyltransferase [Clostridiales Family XIII bacterium]|nr:serine O-acetyltransferase [Clostridiales Family XIII bacterium]
MVYIDETGIKKLVEELLESYSAYPETARIGGFVHIEVAEIEMVLEKLRKLIYPGFFESSILCERNQRDFVRDSLLSVRHSLVTQIERVYKHDEATPPEEAHSTAAEAVDEFLAKLPAIREMLDDDVDAFLEGDPAAENKEGIVLSYPGLHAITVYRLAHELYEQGVPILPRMMGEYAHSETGIEISPGAKVGKHFFIDHGTGIVIGETSVVGDNVKIYQGVTLGAHSTRGGRKLSGVKRHPNIEDNVTIYANATILGGDTTIGEGSVIGGNAFITKSIPPNSRVSGVNDEAEQCPAAPMIYERLKNK